MPRPTIVNAFIAHPWRSLLLALLALLMALLFFSGWLPDGKKYLPGHGWLMAGVSAGLAVFFIVCAGIGFRKHGD